MRASLPQSCYDSNFFQKRKRSKRTKAKVKESAIANGVDIARHQAPKNVEEEVLCFGFLLYSGFLTGELRGNVSLRSEQAILNLKVTDPTWTLAAIFQGLP
jgi:hypothetical protein